jgi:hypothetical protein
MTLASAAAAAASSVLVHCLVDIRLEKIEFQKVGGEIDNKFLYELLVLPIIFG